MKKRINIFLDEETVETLKKLAETSHKNVSQWISDAVWNSNIYEEGRKLINDKYRKNADSCNS